MSNRIIATIAIEPGGALRISIVAVATRICEIFVKLVKFANFSSCCQRLLQEDAQNSEARRPANC